MLSVFAHCVLLISGRIASERDFNIHIQIHRHIHSYTYTKMHMHIRKTYIKIHIERKLYLREEITV